MHKMWHPDRGNRSTLRPFQPVNRRFFIIVTLAVVLSVLVTSCAVNPVTGKRELMFLSESEELRLGDEAAPSLKWTYGGEFQDVTLKAYLTEVVKKIWQISERPYLPVEFYVSNTSLPNAFALPGHVSITRGLLAELDSEAQFVAIIGHEVGHVMARHTAKRVTLGTLQQLGLVIGGLILKDSRSSDLLLSLGALGSSLILLQYDRQQELQADRLGVRYMALVGYDPREAITAHEKLEMAVENYLRRLGRSRKEETFLDAILSTHPRSEVRIEEIKEMIASLPEYKLEGDGRFRDRFLQKTEHLRRINRVYFLYDRALQRYKGERFYEAIELLEEAISKAPSEAPFYNLYGMIHLRMEHFRSAVEMFQKALQRDSGYQPAFYGLGLLHMERGQYKKAIEFFDRSLSLYPEHPGSLFGKGKSLFKLRQYPEAIPYLRRFSRYSFKHPEVHGLLGICYEKMGMFKDAVREYELQVRIAPNTELGIYAQQRILLLRPFVR